MRYLILHFCMLVGFEVTPRVAGTGGGRGRLFKKIPHYVPVCYSFRNNFTEKYHAIVNARACERAGARAERLAPRIDGGETIARININDRARARAMETRRDRAVSRERDALG